ncbi:MAG: RsmD family RNA methyltransferase, partial [Pseudomonadota bacterium]
RAAVPPFRCRPAALVALSGAIAAMRIVGGRFRGHGLAAPGAAGGGAAHLRPTADRVREALFNLLAHGPYDGAPEGRRVLDLFAGAGTLGLEALSRGALFAVFVDDHAPSRALIRRSVDTLGLAGVTKIWRRDATRLGPCRGAPFDLVFADPPYDRPRLAGEALSSARAGGWLAPGALVVVESAAAAPAELPDWLARHDTRRYGEAEIAILQHDAEGG